MNKKKTILCVVISLVILSSAWGEVEKPRIGVGWARLLNLVPGFGVGSFLQGDGLAAVVQMLAEGIFEGSVIYVATGGDWGTDVEPGFLMAGLPLACLAGMVGYGLGFRAPSVYDSKYRAKHRSDEVSIGISPSITPSAHRRGFEVGMEMVLGYALD